MMSSMKSSPLPKDVVGTSTAIVLATAKGTELPTNYGAGIVFCSGLHKVSGFQSSISVISFDKSHNISLNPAQAGGFVELPNDRRRKM